MPNPASRDILQKTDLTQSETNVLLSRETIAASIALLSRVKQKTFCCHQDYLASLADKASGRGTSESTRTPRLIAKTGVDYAQSNSVKSTSSRPTQAMLLPSEMLRERTQTAGR